MFHPVRREYTRGSLERNDLEVDPFAQFQLWFDVAIAAGVPEPDAMCLATATRSGKPSSRMVLLRGFDARGFCFFTNYQSRKGRELDANPFAALTFFWQALERQVRIEGRVEKTSDEESDCYFQTRPVNARVGAWASPQSDVVPDRAALEARIAQYAESHPSGDVSRPPHWGGYRVSPRLIEFWQGRADRLHDRFQYRKRGAAWVIERLAP